MLTLLFLPFERILRPTEIPPEAPPPPLASPRSLLYFYWHYARQARGLIAALFVTGFAVAWLDTRVPLFIGRIVGLGSVRA
jgi:ATP-binding cassette subfamily B multidrug efflux pump